MTLVVPVRNPPQVLGGGGASGFVANPPFIASGIAGNGNALVITRSAGIFAPKIFSTKPWLFDTVDHQYLNGVDQNAYAGFADGTDIAHLIYLNQSKDFTGGQPPMKYYTSRPLRTARDAALYAQVAMGTTGKGYLGQPTWPGAFGTQNNQQMYVSWWMKSKLGWNGSGSGNANAGDQSTKMIRVDLGNGPTGSTRGGANYIAAGTQGAYLHVSSSATSFISFNDFVNTWVRMELWCDQANGIWDWWVNQKFQSFNYTGYGGIFEISHPGDVLYSSNRPADVYWAPGDYALSFPSIAPAIIGWDDGHGKTVNNDMDIAQIYVDCDLAHFEISDSAIWDIGPTATANREIQGRWSRDSSTQCTVYQSQGQFASLPGKCLWYAQGRNTAELVGVFT